MTATIGWTEALPSDGSLVGVAPPEIRSLWSGVAAGLGANGGPLYWPGSGGGSEASAGQLQPGALRAYYDTHSASSNAGTLDAVGRLFVASDRSRVYLYESSATRLVGSRFFVEHLGTAKGIGTVWVTQRGETPLGSATTTVTFDVPFTAAPLVSGSCSQATSTLEFTSINVSTFRSTASTLGGATSNGTLYWWARGLVSAVSA